MSYKPTGAVKEKPADPHQGLKEREVLRSRALAAQGRPCVAFAGDASFIDAAVKERGSQADWITATLVRTCGPFGVLVTAVSQAAERRCPVEASLILDHAHKQLAVLEVASAAGRAIVEECERQLDPNPTPVPEPETDPQTDPQTDPVPEKKG